MAIEIDGKVYRNLEEQVLKNKEDIAVLQESGGGGAVKSVNGKTGTVVLNASDIMVTNSRSVQQNLERIDEEIEDLIDSLAPVATSGSYSDLTDKYTFTLVGTTLYINEE